MHRSKRLAIALLINLSMVATVFSFNMPATAQVKTEVRGQPPDSSDGRSTSFSGTASGLTTPDHPGVAALAFISYPWAQRLPDWTISFEDGDSSLRGLTFSIERRIEIYVRDTDTAADTARVLAHELGHAVDLEYNDTADRITWRHARRLDVAAPWWPSSGFADFATGAGDFAECFATWQVRSSSLSRLASECTVNDLELVATLA